MKNSSLWLWLLASPNMSIKLHKTFNNFSCRSFLVVSVLGHSFLFPRIMGVPHFWKLCLPCCHFFDRLCDNISLELLLGSKCLWFESLFSKYRTLFPCISLLKILVSLLAKFWYALVRLLFDVFYQGKTFLIFSISSKALRVWNSWSPLHRLCKAWGCRRTNFWLMKNFGD